MTQTTAKKNSIFTAEVISLGRVTIDKPIRTAHSISDGKLVTLQVLDVIDKPEA